MKTLIDKKGRKFFLLPAEDFSDELEDLIDGHISKSRKNEECTDFEKFIEENV